ncbi:MAG: hypothetical protein RLZZ118_1385 [Bacteroidota bacterium]|jgi:hypothetical protein
MLKLLGRFGPLGTLLLYLLNWLLKLKYVLYPDIQLAPFNNNEVGLFYFPSIYNYALAHPQLYTILSIHALFFMALVINYFWMIEKLSAKNSLLPGLSIVIISSLLPSGFLLSLYYFIALLLIVALRLIFSTNIQLGANSRLFRAGVLMGCIVMMKPIFVIVALSLLIVIAIIKAIDGRSILAYFFGCIIPIYLFFGIVWILSPALLPKIGNFQFALPKKVPSPESLMLSFVAIIWFSIHGYFLKQSRSEIGGIQIIKKWMSLRIVWIALFITAIFGVILPTFSFFIWLLFSALLIFQSFNMVLNKKWANFTLVFLILVILINEWVFL